MPQKVFDALTVLEDYALESQITKKMKQFKITDMFLKQEKYEKEKYEKDCCS